MKKIFGSFVAVLGMLAALMLGSTGIASATGNNHTHCHHQSALVVVCDVDILTNPNLVNPDLQIIVEVSRTLNDVELELLEVTLENIDINVEDLLSVETAVKDFFDSINVTVTKITILVCALVVQC